MFGGFMIDKFKKKFSDLHPQHVRHHTIQSRSSQNIQSPQIIQTPRIPMVFHFIWLGPKPIPTQYITTWMTFHPKWQIIIWTDNNLPRLINQSLFEKSKVYAQKADILRYELLWNCGGIYVDIDFECLRNIESLIQGILRFAAYQKEKEINNAIIGSIAKDDWMFSIIKNLARFFREEYGAETGPNLITDQTINREDVIIFPKELFYPYLWYEREQSKGPFPNSYGVHHWMKTW
jgi:mannosyltransferase OCH1-like enzyme